MSESSNARRRRWPSRSWRRPARSSSPSRAVRPITSNTITATVPIQEKRSLRTATLRLCSAAWRSRASSVAVAGSTTLSRASARSKSRARSSANSSTIAGRRRSNASSAPAAPRLPSPRRTSNSSCIDRSVVFSSAWTGERDAAARGRLPLQRADAVGGGLDGHEGLVARTTLVGVPVQGGDAERRRRRDERDDGGDQDGPLPAHSPRGGRPEDAVLDRAMSPALPW